MKHFKIGLGTLVLIGILISVLQAPASPIQAASLAQPPLEPQYPVQEAALREAFSLSIQGRTDVLAYVIYQIEVERVQFSEDGQVALLFLQMRDREIGEVIATEPGLAIGRLNSPADGSQALDWKISLQADADWVEQVTSLPAGMLTEEGRLMFLPPEDPDGMVSLDAPIRGYKLPWAAGLTKNLSGSIGHFLIYFSCSELSCRYAYDFADGTMFPLLASRGGTVFMRKDSCLNGDENCSNYIVLEDRSTTPWTYQLYLHIANESIPDNLTVGASVLRGQYIANVDDTGYSTGHHLHFHVHTNASSYWGNSVDIAFDEVPFNDGEPRTCYERDNWPEYGTGCANSYTSQNLGANPPTGALTQPNPGGLFTTSMVPVAGSASDDIAVLKIQPVVNYGSGWVEVGTNLSITPAKTVSFSENVDLCSANVPDGPLQFGVYAYDYEGNRSVNVLGERQIFKSATCSLPAPPACLPTSSQVALFTDVDYKGTCKTFNIGNYTEWNGTLPSTIANQVDSILVGSSVTVTGYDGDYDPTYIKFAGRGETYYTSDANLADNKFTSNRITAIRVQSKSVLFSPVVDLLGPDLSRSPFSTESLILSAVNGNEYENADGANTFTGTLSGPSGTVNLPEKKYPIWSVGNLAAGSYTFTATARSGSLSKSDSKTFSVVSATLPAAVNRGVPFLDNMESGSNDWYTSGLWRQFTYDRDGSSTTVWGYNHGTGYNSDTFRGGDLTSPPINLPANGAYLRFDYLYQTESPNPVWDQRLVQVSVNGGAFSDLLQLSDDPMNYWLRSPVINLTGSAYAGQTIRIRFHFNTLDWVANANLVGWLIDNVSLTATPPDLTCAESSPNDTPATATSMIVDSSKSGVICTGGDLDYYSFSASAGQRLVVSTDAVSLGSVLDSVVKLLDSDGKSVLVENDDASAETQDSYLTYTVQRSGTYYLRVSAWDHPSGGSPLHTYTLNLAQDLELPVLGLIFPTSQWVPGPVFPVTANLVDPSGSGAAKVDVYFHSTDWINNLWEWVGTDTNPADGFYIPLDLTSKNPAGGSLLVQGFDLSGRSVVALISPLTYDTAPPIAGFTPIAFSPTPQFTVQWSLSDLESGLAGFSIEKQADSGAWATWLAAPALDLRQSSFSGESGHSYGFRLQAVDQAGNVRSYPLNPEISVCIPDAYEELDDQAGTAPMLNMYQVQQHNLCASGDSDWLKLQAVDARPLMLALQTISPTASFKLSLFASDGQTLLQQTSSSNGSAAVLYITPPSGGVDYLLRVQALDGVKTDIYTIQFSLGYQLHMPVIRR